MSIAGRVFLPVFYGIWNLVRQPILVHDRQLAIDLTPVPDWHAPFLRGFKCGQIQGFQQRLSTWENAPLPVQFAVGSIETLNRVSRIDDRPDVGRKLKDWCDDILYIFFYLPEFQYKDKPIYINQSYTRL